MFDDGSLTQVAAGGKRIFDVGGHCVVLVPDGSNAALGVHAIGVFETVFAYQQDLELRIDGESGTQPGKSSADDEDVNMIASAKVRMTLGMERDEITHVLIIPR